MKSKIFKVFTVGALIAGVSKIAFDFGAKMGMAHLISKINDDEVENVVKELSNSKSKWCRDISKIINLKKEC